MALAITDRTLKPGTELRNQEPSGFRPDIEGLRAVAVGVVLLYHANVPFASGGFVGVDVFFVISGFLITRMLLDEALGAGRISFGSFYAGRARRILPSAALVLIVVAAASELLLSPLRDVGVERDVRDAALYIVNWHFIAQQTSYMHAGASPSPVLNYWSLSVEEQFYLAWPLLLMLAVTAARVLRLPRWLLLSTVTLGVGAASLAASLCWTTSDPQLAYFSSLSRAWQFAAGGLLALLGPAFTRAAARRTVRLVQRLIGVLGLLAIAGATVSYNQTTAFPGLAAVVPTLGAVAVIAAGAGTATVGVGRLLGTKAPRVVGRYSYCLYLWHWPLLVVLKERFAASGWGWGWQLVVVLASALPAWVTVRLVERPLRFSPVVRSSASCGLAVGATATCLTLGCSLVAGASVIDRVTGQGRTVEAPSVAARLAEASRAAAPFGTSLAGGGPLTPSVLRAPADAPVLPAGCVTAGSTAGSRPCIVGNPGAEGFVALIGDATALQWIPTVEAVAEDHGWSLEVWSDTGCTLTGGHGASSAWCAAWLSRVAAGLGRSDPPVLTFLSTSAASTQTAGAAAGFGRAAARLRTGRTPMIELPAPPTARAAVLDCLASSLGNWAACAEPRSSALKPDPVAAAVAAGRIPGTETVGLASALCPPVESACPAASDGVLLYRSVTDLTLTAATDLGPTLESRLEMRGLVGLHLGPSGTPRGNGPTVPSPAQAVDDWPIGTSRCLIGAAVAASPPCYYGDLGARQTMVLFGDSHALEWVPALDIYARQHGWRLAVYAKEGCPAPLLYPWAPGTEHPYTACTAWRANSLESITVGPPPVLLVLASLSRYTTDEAQIVAGWQDTLSKLEPLHAPTVYMRDTPWGPESLPECVSGALGDWSRCSFQESGGVLPDPVAKKLRLGWFPDTQVVDLDPLLCPGGECPAVMDGIDLYIDQSHITATASAALAPVLSAELDRAAARLGVESRAFVNG